jgi:hypothetical protein
MLGVMCGILRRGSMAHGSRPKRPRDVNQPAKLLVGIATGEVTEKPESIKAKSGRAGGLKGGVTRMSQLSNEDRAKLAT